MFRALHASGAPASTTQPSETSLAFARSFAALWPYGGTPVSSGCCGRTAHHRDAREEIPSQDQVAEQRRRGLSRPWQREEQRCAA